MEIESCLLWKFVKTRINSLSLSLSFSVEILAELDSSDLDLDFKLDSQGSRVNLLTRD